MTLTFDLGIDPHLTPDRTGSIALPCGCTVSRDGTIGYALVTCSENHFSLMVDTNKRDKRRPKRRMVR